jgi:hypothetical protein
MTSKERHELKYASLYGLRKLTIELFQGSEETSEQSVAVCIAEMIAAQRFNEMNSVEFNTFEQQFRLGFVQPFFDFS